MSIKHVKCAYIRRDGSVCGKNCFDGVCSAHMRCNTQRRCIHCGRGTQSVTGICGTAGSCRAAQHAALLRGAYAAKKAPLVTATELDALVDELLVE
jgi:hypothetical protein